MFEELKKREFWLSSDNQRQFMETLFNYLPFTAFVTFLVVLSSFVALVSYFFPSGQGLANGFPALPITDWPVILWFFVMDCPVYALLYLYFIYDHDKTREGWKLGVQQVLYGVIWTGLLKASVFGVSIYLLTVIFEFFLGTLILFNVLLGLISLLTHLAMIVAAIVMMPFMTVNRRTLALFGVWMAFNDFLDFFPIFFPIANWLPTLALWRASEPFAIFILVIYIATDVILLLILFKISQKTSDLNVINNED
ncbi:MAG: DUF1405 domain-containing protein [Candidatus Hodarchaeota archaeon]